MLTLKLLEGPDFPRYNLLVIVPGNRLYHLFNRAISADLVTGVLLNLANPAVIAMPARSLLQLFCLDYSVLP